MRSGKFFVRFWLVQFLLIGGACSTAGFATDNFTRKQLDAFSFCRRNLSLFSGHEWGNQYHKQRQRNSSARYGWLENFFEPNKSSSANNRQLRYPEQYPATYEPNDVELEEDATLPEAKIVRQLLKNTQLESRALQLVYDGNRDGWNPTSFHSAVDGKGAAVVIATDRSGKICGGYNPKGQSSLGGARPSVAAFLFYERRGGSYEGKGKFQKLQKVGGGGLACARDDPSFGISFGPDSLVIGLQAGREKVAQSKLGPYFERGPEDLPSLFWETGGATELKELKVLVGCYAENEEIPYSGGVLDMTSG
eukprot:jgi/Psemu1/209461/e_gw1.500.9.1